MISSKELKKLADVCRKSGIKHFKSAEFEFTLSEESLPKTPVTSDITPNGTIKMDGELSDEEKLFWSVGSIPTQVS